VNLNKADSSLIGEADDNDAKNILQELKKQQEEQMKLLEEQRQIIAELKQHQKQIHHEAKVSPAAAA